MTRAATHGGDGIDNSGSYTVPPVYQPLPPAPSQLHQAPSQHITLQGVLDNQVIKLLAGLALAVTMAYVSMTVSRIDDRLATGEAADARHDKLFADIDKWRVEHRFEVSDQGRTNKQLLTEYRDSLATNKEILERIAVAIEHLSDIANAVAPYERSSRQRNRSRTSK